MDYNATSQALALCMAMNVPVALWGKPGHGKALANTTPIPTPTGWTTMGELRPGDQVFDDQGRPTNVVAYYPQPDGRECFVVEFDNGERIVADAEHLWEVEISGDTQLLTTRALVSQRQPLHIPAAKALVAPVEPCQGDWHHQGTEGALVASTGVLSPSVHPTSLLRQSVSERHAYLQGFLDELGEVDHAGRIRVRVPAELTAWMYELIVSLGHKVTRNPSADNSDSVELSFTTDMPLFSRSEKLSRLKIHSHARHRIVRIATTESVPVSCITVDSPSRLYLAGTSMIPTHNTSVIQHISRSYGLHLETVMASIREPSDFAGLPYFENGTTRLAAPSWAARVVQKAPDEKSVVFFDEVSTAPPATQAALLRPIIERVVGEIELPAATRIVAAANPPGLAADGWDLSPPAANRFTHLDWELDASIIKQGFTQGWPHIEIPILPRRRELATHVDRAMALVGTFVGRNPQLATGLPPNFAGNAARGKDFQAASYAFPTPRSWEVAARLYAAYSACRFADGSKPLKSVLMLLITGTVGIAAGKEFIAFAQNLDLPDPRKLLDDPSSYVVPERGDQLDVVLSALYSTYAHNPTTQNWLAWGDLLAMTVDAGKGDIAYSYMLRWNELRPEGALPTREQAARFKKILGELSER